MEQKGDLETEISSLTSQVADFETAQEQYLDQTPALVLTIVPTTLGSPDATGSIFADPAGTSAVLSVAGMPPLGSDSAYQIWYLPEIGAASVPGPVFTVDATGNAVVQTRSCGRDLCRGWHHHRTRWWQLGSERQPGDANSLITFPNTCEPARLDRRAPGFVAF